MSPISIALLALQLVVFLIWAFLAFRWLFALRADAVKESGSAFPGPASQLRAFRGGLVDERYAKDRVRLVILTLILLTSSLVQYLLSPAGNG
jgi:hypothetical protein